MSQPELDPRGEAHEALNLAVSTYGPRVLSNPRILANHIDDLLPDLPRERSLLVTAAKADVAGELTRHVEEFHLDPDTTVRLVALALAERMSIDPAAGTWVTTEYARALGYPVRPYEQVPAAPAEAVSTVPPPAAPSTVIPPPVPRVPPPPPGPDGVPADGDSESPRPGWWKRAPVIAPILVAVVVVVYVAFAAVVHTPPFTHPAHPQAGPTSPPTHPGSAVPSASLPPGIAPLTQLLPADLYDPQTQCRAYTPAFHVPGLTRSLTCIDHGLPGGSIFAYQANSYANYQTALQNFNIYSPFYVSSAGSTCPPAGTGKQAEGIAFWHDFYYPTRPGQIVECHWAGNHPTYIWTFPTEDAFIVAVGATTFSALDSWFVKNGLPLSSPNPAAS